MKRNFVLLLTALFLCTSYANADEDLYKRVVLLEEFTTEHCGNCPERAALIKEVMDSTAYQGNVLLVTHHSAYYTDWLTTEADIEYKWFFNYKSTYAPAIMFDRYPFFETKGRPGTDERKPTPVGGVNNRFNMVKYLDRRLADKAHVGFYLTGQFDNESTIKVRMSGVRDSLFCDTDPRVTVYVVENNIKAKQQAAVQGDYYHSHVLRAYNSIWGDVITWNGDTFEYECELPIDPEWNKDNIEVVAFVHAYDATNPGNCAIENARSIDFKTILGIDDAQTSHDVMTTEYFTVDGIKTVADAPGLYIEKTTFTDGTTEVRKINR